MSDLVEKLRGRDQIIVAHHQRSGRKVESPMTLEGFAADEIERLCGERDRADDRIIKLSNELAKAKDLLREFLPAAISDDARKRAADFLGSRS